MTTDMQKQIFMNNLLSLLESRELTQAEVARAIGVSPQTFNTWCTGVALPRMGKIQLLADYFHVDKSYLIDEHSNQPDLPANILTPAEQSLLTDFRQLNDEGQDKVCEYTSDLVASGRYNPGAGDSAGSGSGEDETA